MSSPRDIAVGIALLCCLGVPACSDGPTLPPNAPYALPEQPAPPVVPPVVVPNGLAFVVDTGPIPDGRLAFELETYATQSRDYLGTPPRIYAMRTDGSELVALTPAGESARSPAWSPDGARLAYQGFHDDAPEIWTVRADGTGRTLVARRGVEPFWLDDTHLGYQCGASLCSVRDDGTQQRVMLARDTNPEFYDIGYKLSPDRRTIAFTRYTMPGPNVSVHAYVMNADGTGERMLAPTSQSEGPQWSPVDRSIALASSQYGTAVASADGDAVTSLSLRNGAQLPRGINIPAWSPSGTAVVFGNDIRAFFIARADGTGMIRRIMAPIAIAPANGEIVNAWAWTSR